MIDEIPTRFYNQPIFRNNIPAYKKLTKLKKIFICDSISKLPSLVKKKQYEQQHLWMNIAPLPFPIPLFPYK